MKSPTFTNFTQLAIAAARKGADIVMDFYGKGCGKSLKSDNQPVTPADIESSDVIIKELGKSRCPVISEESFGEEVPTDRFWLVDPLDGTFDFLAKTGEFSVMIALVEKYLPILGVVYWPVKNIFYVAERGSGAYRISQTNGDKMEVNKIEDVKNARAVISRHHFSPDEKEFLDYSGIRSYEKRGSSGLKIAAVAEGDAEFYFTSTDRIKLWDTAAGFAVLSEAGGKLSDLEGNPLVYDPSQIRHPKGILASNGYVHEKILKIYHRFVRG